MRRSLLITLFTLSVTHLFAQTEPVISYVNLDINTEGSDYNAVIFQDSLVVFTSVQKKSGRKVRKSINRVPYTDLYVATLIDSQVVNPRVFAEEFSTVFNEADATFTPDFKTVFYTSNNVQGKKRARQDDQGAVNLQIMRSTIDEEGKWSEPEKLAFIDEAYSYAQPSVTPDGKRMYFSSNMPGSLGASDIYYIELYADGRYSAPVNLGFNINSPASENFPSVEENGELYFSSNRGGGFGGLDIYKAEVMENGFFSAPQPLGQPYNSAGDDFGYKYNEHYKHGFYSSNREGGKGSDDIYMFFYHCEFMLEGYVRNAITNDTVQNAIVYLYDQDSTLIDSMSVGQPAQYSFSTGCDANYSLTTRKNLFQDSTQYVSSDSAVNNRVMADLFLSPIINEKMVIMIGPIYFDFDDSKIRETIDGKEEMDRIVELMQANPSMVVEVASYTDSRGDTLYNQRLSQERADSTVSYIVKAGIDSTRIYGKGYGEANLVNGCSDGVPCSLEEHQLNRRTEFKVVSMEGKEFEQIVRTNEAYKEEDEDEEDKGKN